MSAAQRNGQRRQQRRKTPRSGLVGWISVAVVLVVVAVFVIVKVTGSSSPPAASTDSAGRNPPLAPTDVTGPITSVPSSVFDTVGVASLAPTFTVTAKQPFLKSNGLAQVVYEGGEFCPYCAMERWALVAGLARFGTFTGLKQIVSSSTDSAYQSIPTVSFLGSHYTSKYVAFTPYEEADIADKPLESPPAYIQTLYSTYDDTGSGSGTKFNGGQGGIPFIDVANQYVSSGAPAAFAPVATALQHNGLTHAQIADSIKNPASPVGTAMSANLLDGEANYLAAAICAVDGKKPASVCSSKGVAAAAAVLKSAKKVS
jgi:hypothetical protein